METAINNYLDVIGLQDTENTANTSGAPASSNTSMGYPPPPDLAASASGDDDVRAPIPEQTMRLVEPAQDHYVRRNMTSSSSTVKPSSQDPFRDFYYEMTAPAPAAPAGSRQQKLAELFRPPLELIFRGPMWEAKEVALKSRKLLCVNIQEPTEFSCQVLNRDLWKDKSIQRILSDYYIFLQVYAQSEEGKAFRGSYHVNATPFVGVIDPVTNALLGEMHALNDASSVQSQLEMLVVEHGMDAEATEAGGKRPRYEPEASDPVPGSRLSEDEMLAMAIAASLNGGNVDGGEQMQAEAEAEEGAVHSPPFILPPEPEAGQDSIRVQIRTPVGKRINCRFNLHDKVLLLCQCVAALSEVGVGQVSLKMMDTPAGTEIKEEHHTMTLEELGCANSVILATLL